MGSSPLTRGKPGPPCRSRLGAGLIPAHAGKTSTYSHTRAHPRAHPRSRGENPRPCPPTRIRLGSSPLTRGKHVRAEKNADGDRLIPAHAGKTTACSPASSTRRAHPRSRGENVTPSRRRITRSGSSPLTRGKLAHVVLAVGVRGLIPAHAGKTFIWSAPPLKTAAHPRSRGENETAEGIEIEARGSSPLTRGKQRIRPARLRDAGLIPAHAGKTPSTGACRGRWRAHPRSRGENNGKNAVLEIREGSSPLTRGKRHGEDGSSTLHGLIPAHAGKTPCNRGKPGDARAHPRSRGENGSTWDVDLSSPGSSPLTRGKPAYANGGIWDAGLIPAHAGKTPTRHTVAPCPWAHPRSRGENNTGSWRWSRSQGSSPLTRGKRVLLPDQLRERGLIPAHAGKTAGGRSRGECSRAHPRSRGENPRPCRPVRIRQGSSPLTRGKHIDRTRRQRQVGLIPAHAGKTACTTWQGPSRPAHPRSRGENLPSWLRRNTASGSSPLTRGKPRQDRRSHQRRRLIPAHAGKTTTLLGTEAASRAHPRSRGENISI